MKCEHVQECFPEMLENLSGYPQAAEHLKHCTECNRLFFVFKKLAETRTARIPESLRRESYRRIRSGMRRHDLFVIGRRTLAAAAVLLLVFFSLFRNGTGFTSSPLAAIPDNELFLISNAEIMPEPEISNENIIEYLASYEYIEELGNLF
ncbi:MAG: hypothetical protein WC372_02040 [Candidatus Neomarinimicrobiota bacterium]|jgi:hypothetical protein|nr:hypothetical protein [Candidatus Neomarinimicrobiota bacterium]MDX9779837.1 hypothetical protein [bacterium]